MESRTTKFVNQDTVARLWTGLDAEGRRSVLERFDYDPSTVNEMCNTEWEKMNGSVRKTLRAILGVEPVTINSEGRG